VPSGRRLGRFPVNFLLSRAGTAAVDQRARDEGLLKDDGQPNRSEMLRILLAYAMWKMPKGWRPK
jgi:hypothetical protein